MEDNKEDKKLTEKEMRKIFSENIRKTVEILDKEEMEKDM